MRKKKKQTKLNKIKSKFKALTKPKKIIIIIVSILFLTAIIGASVFAIYTGVTSPPKNVTASDMTPIEAPSGYKAVMFKNTSFVIPSSAIEKSDNEWYVEDSNITITASRITFTEDEYVSDNDSICSYLESIGIFGINEYEVGEYKSGIRMRMATTKESAIEEYKYFLYMQMYDVSESDQVDIKEVEEELKESDFPFKAQIIVATHDNSKTWDIIILTTQNEKSESAIDEYASMILWNYKTGQY